MIRQSDGPGEEHLAPIDLDTVLEGYQVIGRDYRYLYLNQAAARHGRAELRDLVGRSMLEVYPGIEGTALFAALRHTMHDREPQQLEQEFCFPDGSKGWYELRLEPVPEGVVILSLDVSERKQAEAARLRLTALLRCARSLGHVITRQRDRRLLIQETCTLLARSLTFHTCCIVLHDGARAWAAAGEDSLEAGPVAGTTLAGVALESRAPQSFRRAVGEAEASLRPGPAPADSPPTLDSPGGQDTITVRLVNGDKAYGALILGLPVGVAASDDEMELLRSIADDLALAIRSIELESAHQRAEQSRETTETKYRDLVANLEEVVYSVDAAGRIQYMSPAVERVYGFSLAEVQGQHFSKFVHPEDIRGVMASFEKALRGTIEPQDFRAFDRFGRLRHLRSTPRLRQDAEGIHGVDGIILDITHQEQAETERRAAEVALRKSEIRYRSLFDNTSMGIAHCRMLYEGERARDFVYLDVNPAFETLTGLRNVVGRAATEAIPGIRESDWELFEIYGNAARSGIPQRFEIQVKALGAWFDVSVYSPQRDHFVAVFDVITERKRTEAELAEGKARMRALYDHLPTATFVWRRQADGFVLTDVNEAARTATGGAVIDWVGKRAGQVQPRLPSLEEDLVSCFETHALTRREAECDLAGRPRSLVLTYGFIPSDTVILHIEDMTEQRQAEEQLRLAQRLEAIGRLAGGVAHDFNNLLSVILSYSGFALGSLREPDPMREDLLEIQSAGERAATLTAQLLAFSRKQVLESKVLDLNRIVADLRTMLRRLLGEDIVIVTRLADDLGHIKVDPGQIEQLIVNLAVNARDAMPLGGTLTIETANVELDQDYASTHVGVHPGNYVLLTVSDTGHGMGLKTQQHLFEPFFTTKERGKGTGLGLATVYGIVKQSGGSIWVYSEPGMGAVFKIYLPMITAPADELGRRQVATLATGSETVLVVEDDHMVRRLTERILRNAGYRVLSAAGGAEALLISEKGGQIDLLLTDVIMPGLSGRELAARLQSVRPNLKVLFMSGYTENAIAHHGVLDPGTYFMSKPLTAPDLTRRVRDVLDGSR